MALITKSLIISICIIFSNVINILSSNDLPLYFLDKFDVNNIYGRIRAKATTATELLQFKSPPLNYTAGATIFAAFQNKRNNDPKYREKDIIYREKYKSSGRRKEVSAIRYVEKRDHIIKQCTEYNTKRYKEDPYYRKWKRREKLAKKESHLHQNLFPAIFIRSVLPNYLARSKETRVKS